MPHAATEKWLFGIVLWIDENPVAYGLRLVFNNVLECLKTSYVEEYKKYGPGNLLMSMLIRVLYEKNIHCCDLEGNIEKNKMKWTKKTYNHMRYVIYREGLFGNLLKISQSICDKNSWIVLKN